MTRVTFDVTRRLAAPVRQVWDELVDWPAHGAWIPATRVDSDHDGDPTAVGYTFTGWTGYGPLMLEDRMRVTRCDWDEATNTGVCDVDKLGPVLGGGAGFTVRPDGDGTVLEWREDVTVPYLPGFLSALAGKVGAFGFSMALRKFEKYLAGRPAVAA